MANRTQVTVNIVEQHAPSCGGTHVDPEVMWTGEEWKYTDTHGPSTIVETVTRRNSESDQEFYNRVSERADTIDASYRCPRCYR